MKILLCKVGIGIKLYETKLFDLCSEKIELMKQMHLEKRGFVIFLQWPTFWDFNDIGLLNYIPSGIRICSPLLWRIFFQLGSSPIK